MWVGGFRFFFSSRRRHTRLTCDWSSDVCSSDLARGAAFAQARCGRGRHELVRSCRHARPGPRLVEEQIGRASCRERVWNLEVVAVMMRKASVTNSRSRLILGGATTNLV